jgi:RNA polymerase sigma factor (TIGR02999 family)
VITQYLQSWHEGDPQALDRLTTAIYSELRRIAAGVLRGHETPTVQPTVLVHDLYLQLPTLQQVDWRSRAQFFNIAARVMRNIAVDYARKRRAAKRGGGVEIVGLLEIEGEGVAGARAGRVLDVLLVNELLEDFARDYGRQARVVELKFFGGLTDVQTADVLKLDGMESSERTVARDWTFAKAWMRNRISSK